MFITTTKYPKLFLYLYKKYHTGKWTTRALGMKLSIHLLRHLGQKLSGRRFYVFDLALSSDAWKQGRMLNSWRTDLFGRNIRISRVLSHCFTLRWNTGICIYIQWFSATPEQIVHVHGLSFAMIICFITLEISFAWYIFCMSKGYTTHLLN